VDLLGLGKRDAYGVVGQDGGEEEDEGEGSHHGKICIMNRNWRGEIYRTIPQFYIFYSVNTIL
jgi:hypothetical protein